MPEGWHAVLSESNAGQIVYENIYTAERVSWVPTEVASRIPGESIDVMALHRHGGRPRDLPDRRGDGAGRLRSDPAAPARGQGVVDT